MTESKVTTLADPKEQAALRKKIEVYKSMRGMPGVYVEFAIKLLEDVQRRADEAAAQHDTVAMLRMYEEMKGCE